MFGLGKKETAKKAKASKTSSKKTTTGKGAKKNQAAEAKAMLKAMEQRKKDRPDDCVFC